MRIRIVAAAIMVLLPLYAWAQAGGAIGGTVRDASGAVLPGVTVEATSPALIEKVRTVVTDGTGQYKIVGLPPGVYTVTFALTGFGSSKREGIELTSGFTAAINADLTVGDLAETITVSGESPTIDIQNVARQTVITREVLDTIPSARQYASLGRLIPGVDSSGFQAGGQDFGGTVGREGTRLSLHGGSSRDFVLMMDGLSHAGFSTGNGDNSNAPPADGLAEEINVLTGANSAEVETGGVVVNIIGKSGGNTFRGTAFWDSAYSALQSENIDDEVLQKYDIPAIANKISVFQDINPTVGGPIKRDRLWFFVSYRKTITSRFSPVFKDTDVNDWAYIPDRTRDPQEDERPAWNFDARFTWQATPRNKISFMVEDAEACICQLRLAAGRSPEATTRTFYKNKPYTNVRWSSPVTSRVLIEAATQLNIASNNYLPTPGAVGPAAIDQKDSIVFRSSDINTAYSDQEWHYLFSRASVSYVTGAHNLKVGTTLWNATMDRTSFLIGPPYIVRLLNGLPNQVTYWLDPLFRVVDFNKVGLFAQEQWTLHRATINAGLRFDMHDSSYPDHVLAATSILPERSFPGADVLSWRDLSPRLGVNFDLSGDGKTALKVSASRYVAQEAFNNTDPANPGTAAGGTLARPWNDRLVCPTCISNDFIPQGDPLNPLANGEIGVGNNTFGTPRLATRYDPDWATGWGKRGFNWEFATSIDHELLPNVSIGGGYYRRIFGNFNVTDNVLQAPSDFSTYSITAPVDARLPGGGGQRISDLWDVNPDKRPLVDNVVTLSSKFGKETQHYDGIDVTASARFRKGVLLRGGLNAGRQVNDRCDVVTKIDNPSKLYCHQAQKVLPRGTAVLSYTLPYSIDVAMSYQNNVILGSSSEPNIYGVQANYVATNAQIAPSLGRNLSAGANGTVTVNVIEPGQEFGDRLQQLDLRFAHTFVQGAARIKASADLQNVLNNGSAILWNQSYGTDGAAWLTPQSFVPGRYLKFSVQLDF